MIRLTAAQLATCTGATLSDAEKWTPHIKAAATRWGITKPLHLAAWLAQIGVESARLTRTEENLSYSAERLVAVWPARFRSIEEATPFARNPQALAERVYGGRLGNVQPGDGWRYRGRGLKQLTGRRNYRAYSDASGMLVERYPDLLLNPPAAADSAAWFWHANNCAELADEYDWAGLCARINGGLTGYRERVALTNAAMTALC